MTISKLEFNEVTKGTRAIVEHNARTFACDWAAYTLVLRPMVRKLWRTDRRAFRPFNVSSGCYL